MQTLVAQPLTADAFATFGDVIATPGKVNYPINGAMAMRHHDLAGISTSAEGGRTLLNIFAAKPWPQPLQVAMMERHLLGSQAFMPLRECRWLVVVAPSGPFDVAAIKAFHVDGSLGVNYAPGTWHHPLVVLDREVDFLVVDRGADTPDCEETHLAPGICVEMECR
jgi:ureidoglycolate lyase